MAYQIFQENCSCCHRCELECPAEAIRVKNRKCYIEPDLCVGCGHCVTVCHNGCISDPENPPAKPTPHEKIIKSCDVLVIGAGGAGTVAAAKAADAGKRVILMEKNWEVGGSAAFGHMMRVLYSKWHAAAGQTDRREKMYQTWLRKTKDYDVNNELLRRLLQANSDLTDWLIDAGELQKGFTWGPGRMGTPDVVFTAYDACEFNKVRSDPSCGPGDSGWYITNLLTDTCKRRGGEVLLNTRAVKLLQDENGKVVGALAQDPGGEIEIHAGAVIVASGAFTRNKEIMAKMQPLFYQDEGKEPVHVYTCATCTGDGITMCEELGAHIDYVNKRACMFGPMHHPMTYAVVAMLRNGSTVSVDKFGNPITEMGGMSEIGMLASKPGWMCWQIMDQQAIEETVASGQASSDPDQVRAFSHWERDLNAELRDGTVVKAESPEELAEKLGFDKKVFCDFIAKHNADVRNGTLPNPFGPPPGDDGEGPMVPPPGGDDEDNFMGGMMMEMPPAHELHGTLYAVFMKMFHENAIGGMTIDENTNVIRAADRKPIEGLYAAGDTCRGIMIPGDLGVQYVEGVLSAMTSAMCTGYLAAEKAIEYLDQK